MITGFGLARLQVPDSLMLSAQEVDVELDAYQPRPWCFTLLPAHLVCADGARIQLHHQCPWYNMLELLFQHVQMTPAWAGLLTVS